jgi:WD40 repeat protein
MMEDLGESSGATTGPPAAADGPPAAPRLERLGDYRILREIGRGGMGVVYEAEQESLGRRVALKVLSAGSLLDPKQVRRFEREARAAARLHHTNIVPVFGVGRQDDHNYFVMQFIAGLGLDAVLEDLRRLRRANSEAGRAAVLVPEVHRDAGPTAAEVARSLIAGRFAEDGPIPLGATVTDSGAGEDGAAPPPIAPAARPAADPSAVALPGSSELSASDPDRQYFRSVARVGIQVAEALEYANRQGILHRDIKPSNLLLDGRGNVWVADFGLAKTGDADDLTHTGDILGTIRYMAPERFQGLCDARSDVYSLGLTLYELVALRPAYEAPDRPALIERVLHEEPERLKKLAPGVPRDLETIVAKASAREPAGRYATAGALAEDLKRFVEDRPIRARRVSSMERLARWCRRNKILAASVGVAALALVAVAVVSLLHADRQARHASELRTTLSESNRRLAMLDLESGRIAFEKGHVGEGMVWTVEALRMATAAGDPDWKGVALANLSAWWRHLVALKEIFPHGDQVRSVAFSPDGKTILTGCWDQTARLWDAQTGRPIGEPLEHPDRVFSVAFSPDGRTILTGCGDKTARLWDAHTGRPIGQTMEHPDRVNSVAFSPNGQTILTGCWDGTAQLWDAATSRRIGRPLGQTGAVLGVAYSPDGRSILTGGGDGTARLWDGGVGQPVHRPLDYGAGMQVVFGPDGETILMEGSGQVQLREIASGRLLGRPVDNAPVILSAMALSPDGRMILTAGWDKAARLWDAHTGRALGPPMNHPDGVRAVAFSPDGRTILTGGGDGTVRL